MFLLFCVFLGGWRLFEHLKKHQRNQNIFKKVGWIAEKDNFTICYSSSVQLRDEDLIYYIMNEQAKLNLPEKFCLDNTNETEKKYAEEILNLHKNDVVKSYFCDFLTKSKNICNLNSLEYYMFSLNDYLHKNSNVDSYYGRTKIYKFKSSDAPYSYYSLTDFGRTFFKLYLITNLFIQNNENTRKLYEHIDPNHKSHIMDYLEKNEVSFVSFKQ